MLIFVDQDKNMWSNFHTHSNYCDGKGELRDYVSMASNLGMKTLGFSSHAPLPFERPWCMQEKNFQRYVKEINLLKKQNPDFELYTGLEVDFIPGKISPADFCNELDYTIGSIHFVETLPNGNPWEIDNILAVFMDGFTSLFKNNIRDTLYRYFELTREMVISAPPTVVGHLDKIKIHNTGNQFFREDENWYREMVIATLHAIQQSGSILEINTRGIYQKKTLETYPSPWIILEAHKLGIPLTLNSDAHHPDQLIHSFGDIATWLLASDIKSLTILYEGRWQPKLFHENGLIY